MLGSRLKREAVVVCGDVGDGGIKGGLLLLWGPWLPVCCGRGCERRCGPDVCPLHGT